MPPSNAGNAADCGLAALRGCLHAAEAIASQSAGLTLAETMLSHLKAHVTALAATKMAAPLAMEVAQLAIEVAEGRGRVLRRMGRLEEAIVDLQFALAESKKTANERLIGVCTTNLCRAKLDFAELGGAVDREEIIRDLEQNIDRLTRCDDKRNLAAAWNNLGDALAPSGAARAEECLRKDVEISRELQDLLAIVDSLDRLGVLLSDTDRHSQAIAMHREELELFRQIFDFEREARCLANLGRAELGAAIRGAANGELVRAIEYLFEARDRYIKLDCPPQFGRVLENLGRALWSNGDDQRAVEILNEAIGEYSRWPSSQGDSKRLQQELNDALAASD